MGKMSLQVDQSKLRIKIDLCQLNLIKMLIDSLKDMEPKNHQGNKLELLKVENFNLLNSIKTLIDLLKVMENRNLSEKLLESMKVANSNQLNLHKNLINLLKVMELKNHLVNKLELQRVVNYSLLNSHNQRENQLELDLHQLDQKDQVFQNIQRIMLHLKNQEEKNNGKHGQLISMNGLIKKQKLHKLDFLIIQLFNQNQRLNDFHLLVQKDQDSHHSQQIINH